MESGILAVLIRNSAQGIRNPAQGIRNPADDWIPELEFHRQVIQNPVTKIQNPQCRIHKSNTVLNYLTWSDTKVRKLLEASFFLISLPNILRIGLGHVPDDH